MKAIFDYFVAGMKGESLLSTFFAYFVGTVIFVPLGVSLHFAYGEPFASQTTVIITVVAVIGTRLLLRKL